MDAKGLSRMAKRHKKTLRRLIGKPVRVKWVDAVSLRGWHSTDELVDERIKLTACGILTLVTRDRIALSISTDPGQEKCSSLILPRQMVRKLKRLR
jgi:hypothetical protein